MSAAVVSRGTAGAADMPSVAWLGSRFGATLAGVPLGPDLYLRNPFRLVGLPANASDAEVSRVVGRIKVLERGNLKEVCRYAVRTGYDGHLSPVEAVRALAVLKDPRQRLVSELFWPHVANGFGLVFAKAHSLDDAGLRSDLEARAALRDGRETVLAKHGLAVLLHNLALRDEIAAVHGRAQWSDELWLRAMSLWAEVIESRHFWTYIKERAASLKDPRIRAEDLAGVDAHLWSVLLEFHSVLARSHAETNPALSNGHMLLIAKASCPSETMVSVLGASVKGIVYKRLAPLVAMAQAELLGQKTKLKWQDFRKRCEPILQLASEVITFLAKEVRIGDDVVALAEFDALCDVISSGLSQSVDYAQDRERALLYSMVTTRRLLQFPLSSAGRIKHESTLRQDRQHLYSNDFDLPQDLDPTACWFLGGEPAEPDACIVKSVYKITKLTAANIQWSSRKILIPRSSLANDLHHGRKPQAGFKARANTPAAIALNTELEQVRAKAADAERELDYQRDAARLQVRERHAAKIESARREQEQAETTGAVQINAVEAERNQAVANERAVEQGKVAQVKSAFAPKLQEARKKLEEAEAAAVVQIGDVEAERDQAIANECGVEQVKLAFAPRLEEARKKLQQAEATIAAKNAAIEAEKNQSVAKARGDSDAKAAEIRATHAQTLAEAERELQEARAGKGPVKPARTAIWFGIGGLAVGGTAGFLLDYWFLLPRPLSGMPGITALAVLGGMLGACYVSLERHVKLRRLAQRVGAIQSQVDKELESAAASTAQQIHALEDWAVACYAEISRLREPAAQQVAAIQAEMDKELKSARETAKRNIQAITDRASARIADIKREIESCAKRVTAVQSEMDKEVESAQEIAKRNILAINDRASARIADIRGQNESYAKAKKKLEEAMNSEIAQEDQKIQVQIDAVRKDAEKKAKKLEEKLAALLTPKQESAAADFPAYRSAKSKGFKDGEKPSDSEAQAMMTREFESFTRSLSDHQKMLLQIMLQKAGPGQQAAILERFMEMQGRF